MHLRRLREEDALLMLEWMNDDRVVHDLHRDFSCMTKEDCLHFIRNSQESVTDIHMAVVDDADIYMGTVSLKNIDRDDKSAEFAITVRYCAMGKGFSQYAMQEILKTGLEEMKLDGIYWCVSINNKRAVRFYEKNGYEKTNFIPERIRQRYADADFRKLIWYKVGEKKIND